VIKLSLVPLPEPCVRTSYTAPVYFYPRFNGNILLQPIYSAGTVCPQTPCSQVRQVPLARLTAAYLPKTASRQSTKLSSKLHPFASSRRFWPSTVPANKSRVNPVLPSTPSRAFTGRIFITTTGSSATLHVSPNPLNFFLASGYCARAQAMQGFPGYYSGSL